MYMISIIQFEWFWKYCRSSPKFGLHIFFKGTLSGLRQFLADKTPLKIMKNAFYFILKIISQDIKIMS